MMYEREETFIFVTWQKEGIHNWPGAGAHPGVEFLQHPHRHMFHFRVDMSVSHADREVEFILLKRDLEKHFDVGKIDHRSCEMLAEEILGYLKANYGYQRTYRVEANEDGENGAYVKYEAINVNSD